MLENREKEFQQILQFLDCNHNSSLTEACDVLKLNYANIYSYLKRNHPEFKINTSNNGKQRRKRSSIDSTHKIKDDQLDVVKQLYYTQLLTFKEIGEKYSCNAASVCNFFKRHNLLARDKSTVGKLIFEKDPSKRELARIRGINNYLNQRKANTKPEQQFKQWLENHNINYIEQFRKVGNAHPYDFLLKNYNLLVEIDGHYYHTLPKQIIKDQKQTQDALAKGFNIVRIDTEQLKNNNGDYSIWLNKYIKN